MKVQYSADEVFALVEQDLKKKGFASTNHHAMLSGHGDLDFDGIQADVILDENFASSADREPALQALAGPPTGRTGRTGGKIG